MNKKTLTFLGGAIGAGLLVSVIVAWRVSASSAKSKASELVTAAADMARCLAGNETKLERSHVEQGYERRMVADLPDISTAKPCLLALEVVNEKWATYQSAWFNSSASKAKDGRTNGQVLQEAIDTFGQLPLDKSSDQVFQRQGKYGSLMQAGTLGYDMYEAARDMFIADGASDKEVEEAGEKRMRKAPHSPARLSPGKTIGSMSGRVAPDSWNLIPSQKTLLIHAVSDQGKLYVAHADHATTASSSEWMAVDISNPAPDNPIVNFRVIDAPAQQRWYVSSHSAGTTIDRYVGLLSNDKNTTKAEKVDEAPEGWKRIPGNEREVVVLDGGWKAFSVWRLAEKTDDEKANEKKQREEWNKNPADKEVQALITLHEQKRLARVALGIDEDHKRVDGIAYVKPGAQPHVLDVDPLGIAGLIAGTEPMALVADQGIPTHKVAVAAIRGPGQPLGPMTEGAAMNPLDPAVHRSAWLQCISPNTTTWIPTKTGNFLLAIASGRLEVVPMSALADEKSHLGCGDAAATVALELQKDRIFANFLTVRGQETEGAKVHTTAGTNIEEFNATVASAVDPNATVVGWIARGYALFTVNIKTDHEFAAPKILAEPTVDGSTITSLRFLAKDSTLYAVLTRQKCETNDVCTTYFELLASDDGANSWKTPS